MDNITSSINVGFGNCLFANRNPKVIQGVISERIMNPKYVMVAHRPKEVKVETIDGLHDKLSLIYGDNQDVEGTITWRPSQDGHQYVFTKFE